MNKITDKNIIKDKYLGSLLSGAIGDALGYSVEFMTESEIKREYGGPIEAFDLTNGKAIISDDTQMTMFTANALLNAYAILYLKGDDYNHDVYVNNIYLSYLDWLDTQLGNHSYNPLKNTNSFITIYPSLHASRDPGFTCLSSLRSTLMGTINNPLNNSKGCGGVMRVSPIGLFFTDSDIDEIGKLAASASAITHGNPLGFIPSAMLVQIIHLLSHYDVSLIDAINISKDKTKDLFGSYKETTYLLSLTDKAINLALSNINPLDAILKLGEGWVAEETLAIAIYASLKEANDIRKALIIAVNHNGDSDSTGAVTGNILGAYLGFSKIPDDFLKDLELKDEISSLALDLYKAKYEHDFLKTNEFREKYISKTYGIK